LTFVFEYILFSFDIWISVNEDMAGLELGKVGLRGCATLVKPFMDIPGPRSLPIVGSLLNYIPFFGKFGINKT